MRRLPFVAVLFLFVPLIASCSQWLDFTASASQKKAETLAATVAPTPVWEPQMVTENEPEPTEIALDYCLECHASQEQLQSSATNSLEKSTEQFAAWMKVRTPLDYWQRLWVNKEVFPKTIHGLKDCTSCHLGQQSSDKDIAHLGLVSNPSANPGVVCGQCHPNVVAHAGTNLHNSLAGMRLALEKRDKPSTHPQIEEMFENHCATCHTTCGECHVSQPSLAGGGLIAGHEFLAKPPVTQTCVVCHGTRVGAEYYGENSGLPADVHSSSGEFSCVNCHTTQQLHGEPDDCQACHPGPAASQTLPPDHRYAGIQAPRCESCHPKVSAGEDDVLMHQMHGANLSCQVCHAVAYTNCEGCHTVTDPKTGQAGYRLERQYTAFLIGRNPIQTYERPYRFVTVRHVPVTTDSFVNYGADLLPDFSRAETWKYATPHNIQRQTPQAESCNGCHGNPAWFLTADKMTNDMEIMANKDVIIETLPPLITSADQIP
jgi:hypothetical protein